MKKIMVFVLLIFGFIAYSDSASFSEEENSLILQSINNACGDSWCEGPFMYDFLSFSCVENKESCFIKFVATEDENTFLLGSCKLKPAYEKFEDYVDLDVSGVWPTLKFYEFITDCLSAWETEQFK